MTSDKICDRIQHGWSEKKHRCHGTMHGVHESGKFGNHRRSRPKVRSGNSPENCTCIQKKIVTNRELSSEAQQAKPACKLQGN